MSCMKWSRPSGEVVVVVSDDEYLLYIDFERGIQVDTSPNHENVRWVPELDGKDYELVRSEYRLSDVPPEPEDWIYREFKDQTLEEIQEYILKLFITEMELLGRE